MILHYVSNGGESFQIILRMGGYSVEWTKCSRNSGTEHVVISRCHRSIKDAENAAKQFFEEGFELVKEE